SLVLPLRRGARAPRAELQAAGLDRAARGVSLRRRELEQRSAHRAAGLSQKLLPAFRVGMKFFRRPRAPNRLAHRIETVAYGLGARDFAAEGEVGVFAHAAIRLGLQQVGRGGAEIEPPAELE